MKLIAKKPCSFRGEKFFIGDEIPAEYVLSPREQEKMGVLAIVNEGAPAAAALAMEVVIHAEEGDMPLNVSKEGLQAVVDILTNKVEAAEPLVQEMTDGDALILLRILDDRKTIMAAAEARAKAINAPAEETVEEEGEQ